MVTLTPPFRIVMKGFHGHCVSNVIDWMYYGEVEVPVRFIAEHLAIAAVLEIDVLHKQLEARFKQLAMQTDLTVPCLNIATDPRHQITERTLRRLLAQFSREHDIFSSTDLKQLSLNSILVLVASTDMSFADKVDIFNIALTWLKEDTHLRYVDTVLNAFRVHSLAQEEIKALIEQLRTLFMQPSRHAIHVYSNDGRQIIVSGNPQEYARSSGVIVPLVSSCEETAGADSVPEVDKGKKNFTVSEIEEIARLPDLTSQKGSLYRHHTGPYRTSQFGAMQDYGPPSGANQLQVVTTPTGHGMGAVNLQNIQSDIVNTPVKMACGHGSLNELSNKQDFPHGMHTFEPQRAVPQYTPHNVSQGLSDKKKSNHTTPENYVHTQPEIVPSDNVIGKRLLTREEIEELRAIPPICSNESIKLPIIARYEFPPDEIEHIRSLPDVAGSQFTIGRMLRTQEELDEIKQLPDFEDKIVRRTVRDKSPELGTTRSVTPAGPTLIKSAYAVSPATGRLTVPQNGQKTKESRYELEKTPNQE